MTSLAYLGPEGTFSEIAAEKYARKKRIQQIVPRNTVHDVLQSVLKHQTQYGLVPMENSIEGTVGVVADLLVQKSLALYGEVVIPVSHALLAPKKVPLSAITDILSHPQALEQCRDYLRRHVPHARLHATTSTADAAQQISGKFHTYPLGAAIGPRTAARRYNLKVVAKNIQDYPDNSTRFVIISRHDHPPTGRDKTSIVFSLIKDRPGGLFSILQEFAVRKINLTKIESRPKKTGLGEYYFFLDCEGHRRDSDVASAIKNLKRKVIELKVLGSYPTA